MEDETPRQGENADGQNAVTGFGSMCSIEDSCEEQASCKAFEAQPTRNKFNENVSVEFFQDVIGYNNFFSEARLRPNSHHKLLIDRFVPQRIGTAGNLVLADTSPSDENQPDGIKKEDSQNKQVTISEIYRKHILGVSSENPNEQPMATFQNNNKLKFSHKHIPYEQPISETKSIVSLKEILQSTVPLVQRKINKIPIKVLDAPSLQDDFYLNLIDWSEQNILAVGLNTSVYLWNAFTSRVSKLCELGFNDLVTASSWCPKNHTLAIGTNSGEVQLWDAQKSTKIRTFIGHVGRVGSIAWNSPVFFSSGSRDKNILHRDLRESNQYVDKLAHHKQQVCGLKWSFDHQQLASGGNDNKLLVWNTYSNSPVHVFSQHNAAVKALAWSPHQHGMLVSGGGTADRTIRFWNTLNGQNKLTIDAGSQVCNLMFSKTVNELVSTHGYSLNEINIWRLPKMQKVATLTGHTYRVLYLAMNPEGSTIVTGAGDETLRFWNIFPARQTPAKTLCKGSKSQLTEDMTCLR